ncbi:CDP-glycerol glycerophosphotransferase family protein [Paenibacillus xylanexedens]|uniref:CDP-glycerol glycerophosphotransferase (TagB/SpsB family) n=1 Tax=Paenibacillus xylanexedens TaxID=528191 RepID=A0ABS4RUF0_PAEXY|nr:CDP-glycerol glycerophosphotransferase family protein [Paenibacillus xylanexedens]MBP2246500.1 CDP-glycerol glycerophosphotransferase (TagB/SpsB family) [Paenibacillus xylanexedens]
MDDTKPNILTEKKNKFGVNKFNVQTWEDFNNFKSDKFVFIFGAGYGADFYFQNYSDNIVGIIDNDEAKHGHQIDFFVDKISLDKCKEKKVLNVSVLKQYKDDDLVVLIANLNASEQIAEQLESVGISNYYSLLAMETIEKNSFVSAKDQIVNHCLLTKRTDKIEPNKLVFYSTGGYFGHGKYIAEQLLKQRNDLDIVWVVNDLKIKVPRGIRLVYWKNKSKYIHEMRTAKIWVYDDMVPSYIQKQPEQIYVQVKHWSSVTLKTFGFDFTTFRKDSVEIEMCRHNSEMMDYIITGSKFDTDTCRSGFGFKGEIIQAGSSRSDVLFQESKYRQKVKSHYGLNVNKKILLYAPTFRYKLGDSNIREVYETNINYELIIEKLASKYSDEWCILLRLHPLVSGASKSITLLDYVIDASNYSDSQELVAAADIMITDYSSIMFEPAYVRKPVFLFAPDRKEYINGERKLLIDYDTLPFSIAESNEELANYIENFNQEEYVNQVDEFMEKYGVHEDGHASERSGKFILDLIDGIRS